MNTITMTINKEKRSTIIDNIREKLQEYRKAYLEMTDSEKREFHKEQEIGGQLSRHLGTENKSTRTDRERYALSVDAEILKTMEMGGRTPKQSIRQIGYIVRFQDKAA